MGGSVGIYISENCNHKLRCAFVLDSHCSSYESLFVEVEKRGQNAIIGVIYKHPYSNVDYFTECFNNLLDIIAIENFFAFCL